MVKFLSSYTGPGYATLAKIYLVNELNKAGLAATLYGTSEWPASRCQYQKIEEFAPKAGDIIINDGFWISSYFDLINLSHHRYSHGRKKRVFQILKSIRNYLLQAPALIGRVNCILYRPHQLRAEIPSFFRTNVWQLEEYDLDFPTELKRDYSQRSDDLEIIVDDVLAKNDLAERIRNSRASKVLLAGAIVEPAYFREQIIPLLNQGFKNLKIIGPQEENFRHLQAEDMKTGTLERWKSLVVEKRAALRPA